jgi:hypothetical protein
MIMRRERCYNQLAAGRVYILKPYLSSRGKRADDGKGRKEKSSEERNIF